MCVCVCVCVLTEVDKIVQSSIFTIRLPCQMCACLFMTTASRRWSRSCMCACSCVSLSACACSLHAWPVRHVRVPLGCLIGSYWACPLVSIVWSSGAHARTRARTRAQRRHAQARAHTHTHAHNFSPHSALDLSFNAIRKIEGLDTLVHLETVSFLPFLSFRGSSDAALCGFHFCQY